MLILVIKFFVWLLVLPFKIIYKLLFWWLPSGSYYGYDDYYWWDKFND